MDNFKDLADSLKENEKYIPRARRIFNNLNKIESILSTGITINSLVSILKENGFEIKFESLKNDIYQARKKLKKSQSENVNIVKTNKNVTSTPQKIEPQNLPCEINKELETETTENLTLKQKAERKANAYDDQNDISSNPFIKNLKVK